MCGLKSIAGRWKLKTGLVAGARLVPSAGFHTRAVQQHCRRRNMHNRDVQGGGCVGRGCKRLGELFCCRSRNAMFDTHRG